MATVIFVDQENGDFASTTLFKGLEQANSAKHLFKSHLGKVFGSSGTVVKPRKALGNINKQVAQTAAPFQKGALKLKTSAPVTKQVCIKTRKQNYPEIEKCLPYNPADFETFNVQEEHKLSHLDLSGVPLIVHEHEASKVDALLAHEPAPMDIPVISWESDISSALPSFLAALDDFALDLPQMNCSQICSVSGFDSMAVEAWLLRERGSKCGLQAASMGSQMVSEGSRKSSKTKDYIFAPNEALQEPGFNSQAVKASNRADLRAYLNPKNIHIPHTVLGYWSHKDHWNAICFDFVQQARIFNGGKADPTE
ncbi:PREDICTED: securin-like [Nanorana parkeri]|uniref:securin-like n=1 Tax=Nanorana parkeri TaxID=125878 RepID=UPI0008540E50|nr:PREDICTED: securin-like [Nanorana parkeri]